MAVPAGELDRHRGAGSGSEAGSCGDAEREW